MKFTFNSYLVILRCNKNMRWLRWPGEFGNSNFILWKRPYYPPIKANKPLAKG